MTRTFRKPSHQQRHAVLIAAGVLATILSWVLLPSPALIDCLGLASMHIAQAREGIRIGKDSPNGDRVITVVPPVHGEGESKMEIGHETRTGDHVIHVVPPLEERQDPDVLIGPLFIAPEITWPDRRRPRKPQ